MKEADKVGLKALGMHQHQRQAGVYPMKPQGVQAGLHGRHHNNHHQSKAHFQGQAVPDHSRKPQTYFNSSQFNSQHLNQNHYAEAQGNHHYFNHQFNGKFQQGGYNHGASKPRFQRTASVGDTFSAHHHQRIRCTSGDIDMSSNCSSSSFESNRSFSAKSKSIPASPVQFPSSPKSQSGFLTPVKASSVSTDGYFAMAKFNESPEPSALPAPPKHWQSATTLIMTMSPCKTEYRLAPTRVDGIDFTAHLKTLLRVEM